MPCEREQSERVLPIKMDLFTIDTAGQQNLLIADKYTADELTAQYQKINEDWNVEDAEDNNESENEQPEEEEYDFGGN